MGALLLSAAAASAQSTLNFQVNMSNFAIPAGDTVSVNGSFDGWTGNHTLSTTGNGIYTGSAQNTSATPGNGIAYQYRVIESNGTYVDDYSAQDIGDNYCITAPANGGTANVPLQYWDDDGTAVENSITFQVDMAEQLHIGNFAIGDPVYCEGSFEGSGWDQTFALTEGTPVLQNGNIISLPYTGTYSTWSASPGAAGEFKYTYVNGSGTQWDNPTTGDPDTGNRFVLNVAGALPLVNFSDVPFSNTVTNNITFEVDMSVQVLNGNFTNGTSVVSLEGDFNNYANSTPMIEEAAPNTNIYYYTQQIIDAANAIHQFKYQIQAWPANSVGIWESPAAANEFPGTANRYLHLTQTSPASYTNGPVFFSDLALGDVTPTACLVTFTVDMTPAAPGGSLDTVNSGGAFLGGAQNGYFDTVYINGVYQGYDGSYWTWPAGEGNASYAMTQVGSSGNIYTITLPINAGQAVNLAYKYGIDGQDDEAGSGDNHYRYIRTISNTGSGYVMPTDLFGANQDGSTGESSFGNLQISKVGNQAKLAWLGRSTVYLQSTTSLAPPITWTPLPATDGANLIVTPGNELQGIPSGGVLGTNVSTSFTIGNTPTFYELVGPQ